MMGHARCQLRRESPTGGRGVRSVMTLQTSDTEQGAADAKHAIRKSYVAMASAMPTLEND